MENNTKISSYHYRARLNEKIPEGIKIRINTEYGSMVKIGLRDRIPLYQLVVNITTVSHFE